VHVLPQLRELEERYADQIAVVGVHSGKYTAERVTSRILDASIRLDAIHPTINDRQFRLWRAYAVRAWPTLVAIDPAGFVVGMQAGEFTAHSVESFIERVIADARSARTLVDGPLRFPADGPTVAPATLAFPGKVALDGRRLAIADSGHHRILVGTVSDTGTSLRVEQVIGGGAGYRDGPAPLFRNPQGVELHGDVAYVADAGNHAVRAISLATGAARTVAGTGEQLRSRQDLTGGALSSPWDLCRVDGTLYVALAGIHRLWTVHLADGVAGPFSGTGAEELLDGPHARAALAQPMGICAAGDSLQFVDAESSAVRIADRERSGGVRTIVGTGLFDFGDRDGTGDDVRLQHPQGIAAADGRLLICDSYNDSLKWVDPSTRRVETWWRGFHEPAGVAIGERFVYVADTNAHRIAVIERGGGETRELAIELAV
jgi:hypothetical protein